MGATSTAPEADEELQKGDDTTQSARRCSRRRARYAAGALHDGRESTRVAESVALRQRSRVHARDSRPHAPSAAKETGPRSNGPLRAFFPQPAHHRVETSNLLAVERVGVTGARHARTRCALSALCRCTRWRSRVRSCFAVLC